VSFPTPAMAEWVAAALGVPFPVAVAFLLVTLPAAGYVAGSLLELALLTGLPALARRSATRFDDVVAGAVRGPVKACVFLVSVLAALLTAPIPDAVRRGVEVTLLVVLTLAGLVVTARLIAGLVATYGGRAGLAGSTGEAVRRVAHLAVYLVGLVVVLDFQGVPIGPLLTTLGLAGLALAFALQDTLSNFFGGVYLQADHDLDLGHFVRIEDLNVEGVVVEVGWRTTKIRTLQNNLVVIPNSRVAASVVTDFDLPEPRLMLQVRVPVARGTDPRRLETLLVEEGAAAAAAVAGLLADPAPFVRFMPGFTENGLEVTLVCHVASYVDQFPVQHELRQRLHARLRREGIELAVATRVVEVRSPPAAPAGLVTVVPEPRSPHRDS